MSNKSNPTIATMGIDIGKNSFHVVGLDRRGAIVLRQKWSRGQIEARLANMAPCLPSCWSAALRCARGCAFCAPNCQASLPSALTYYRRA